MNADPGPAPPPRVGRLVLAFALVTTVLLAAALMFMRREALHAGGQRTEALSQVIAEQTARTFQSVDERLQLTLTMLDAMRRSGPVDAESARPLLREQLKDLPFVRAIWVLDREGRIVLDSDVGNIGVSLADREYFQVYRRAPATEFYIGPVVRSRSTGTWLASASRPVRGWDRAIEGVIVAAVEPAHFDRLWSGIDLGANGAIALFRTDGSLMVRSPHIEQQMGRNYASQPLFTENLKQSPQGVFVRAAPIDGVERLTAYRTLPIYPQLVVAVGSSLRELLAPWRSFAQVAAAVWGGALLVAAGLMLQLRRQQRSAVRSEHRLAVQTELLRMATRLARMGGWRIDMAAQTITWSGDAASILDLPPDRVSPLQDILSMLAPASLPAVLHMMQECMDHGIPFDAEVELLTPKGRRVWVRSIGQPVRDADGKVVALQGAQQDITQRVLMVEEIRQLNAGLEEKVEQRTRQVARQEALFRTLAEQAPVPFWTVDRAGRVTFFSRAWYDLAGGTPPQWQGDGWTELLHPDDAQAVRDNWKRSRRTGAVFAGTRRLRAKDGTYHTTSYRSEPVRNASGEIMFWVGIDTDITDLIANQSALRLANEQLEAFSYSVSHDLQSPLQRVDQFAKLLEGELKSVPQGRAQHYLARIRANTDTMTQLIEGLLALAHVSEVHVVRAPVKLSEMATEILQRLQSDHPQRRVDWKVEPGLAVMGDARLLRSVLENLVGNAWKFTSERAVAEIEVGCSPDRGEYFVRDNGAGFDMAYASRLFGTFQRLHDADQFPGTGIGLATVARAISRLGGHVRADAEPGRGATFYFTLPPA